MTFWFTYGEVSVFVPWISAIGRTTAAAPTTKLKVASPVAPAASVAVTVTDDVPAAVGVPEMTPEPEISRPAGRPLAVQAYGVVPPLALRVNENAVPAVAFCVPGLTTETPAAGEA